MAKALSREHLVLAQACECARAALRRMIPEAPERFRQELGNVSAILTRALKARRVRPVRAGEAIRRQVNL
jgi:hypothetical protein